jgi:hypothetical protein
MRIGIDGRGMQKSLDGIGRYTRNLVAGILEADRENEYVIFTLPGVDWSCIQPFSNARTFEFLTGTCLWLRFTNWEDSWTGRGSICFTPCFSSLPGKCDPAW